MENAVYAEPDFEGLVSEFDDYWGNDETVKHILPDGKQYFIIRPMNEGAKSKYQRMANQDVIIDKHQNTRLKVNPADERHTLITQSVIDWNIYRKDKNSGQMEPYPFSEINLKDWLTLAPPHIVERLEHAIRMANPWLQSEMTVDQIDEEIKRLNEMRDQVEREKAGE